MREIKFRGKTLYSREWRYGSLDRDEPQNKYYIMDNETGDGIKVDEETIGQFTGIYDKNKVPIYERRYSKKRNTFKKFIV